METIANTVAFLTMVAAGVIGLAAYFGVLVP